MIVISTDDYATGKTSLGSLRNRCKDNIKMYLKETVCEDVAWIQLVQRGTVYWFL
jgi:hypothetical protein